jgi:hypothetical protein
MLAKPTRLGKVCAAMAVTLALSGLATAMPRYAASALGPCDAPSSPIVAENCLPGTPASQWDVGPNSDATIQGFATQFSVNVGEVVHLKIKTDAPSYHIDIYRIGYYGGDGARLITTILPSAALPQVQPACLVDAAPAATVDCGNWAESASWAVPSTAVSGVYIAKLVRDDTQGASHIPFVVRNDASHSDLLFQTSDETWQAYNGYGGVSLYSGGPGVNPARAYKVSYNRPFVTRKFGAQTYFFSDEYPMIRFLEANGYDVSYVSGGDVARAPVSMLEQHKTFLSVGHDEYWSGSQRTNVETARDNGVNLAFFSGNEIFWKTRWENSIDGSNTAYRTLVCYKETHANAKIDPTSSWTGTWRDPRFSPPADGGRPENALSGTISTVDNGATTAIQVPGADAQFRIWRNTSVATTAPTSTATLAPSTLGYEWDEDLDNGSRPAGEIDLSSTTVAVPERLVDYGSTYAPGTATHSLTMYRKGNSLVFSAGTIQWAWGLDSVHDFGSTADPSIRQATVNVLAEMNAQPSTLQSGLTAGAPSTDISAPTASITSPTSGTIVPEGSVTVTGTAQDVGGGVVAGVEVSTDAGQTWHPATGHENWSYSFTPHAGLFTIRARATDDSVNTGPASTDSTLTVVPTTSILVPSNGASLGGSKTLDARASADATRVEFHATGGSLSDALIGTATLTIYGWIASWDTTRVPDGTYSVTSLAFDASGGTGRSPAISVTVDNTPPTTSILVPSNGATVTGTKALDARATDNNQVTKVEFHATGGSLSDALIGTATLTPYGWIASWDTTRVPVGTYSVTSLAFDASGGTGRSPAISVTVARS